MRRDKPLGVNANDGVAHPSTQRLLFPSTLQVAPLRPMFATGWKRHLHDSRYSQLVSNETRDNHGANPQQSTLRERQHLPLINGIRQSRGSDVPGDQSRNKNLPSGYGRRYFAQHHAVEQNESQQQQPE